MKVEDSFGYLAGVLAGDGYADNSNRSPRICLGTVSLPFARLFEEALKKYNLNPHITERDVETTLPKRTSPRKSLTHKCHLYFVRATTSHELISSLRTFEPKTLNEQLAFIKGFFDSEGSVAQRQQYLWRNGKQLKNGRRKEVRFYNKNVAKLMTIVRMLKSFDILPKCRQYQNQLPYLSITRHAQVERFLTLTNGKFGGYPTT